MADDTSSRKAVPEPVDTVQKLRQQALTVAAADVGIAPAPERQHVWGVIMELGYPTALVTLVGLADGTTSLYFGNGGGVIGAGAHAPVRAATARLLAAAEAGVARLDVTSEFPLPAVGFVRFFVRTFEGVRTGEANEQELAARKHLLSRLYFAGQDVLTAIRENTPKG